MEPIIFELRLKFKPWLKLGFRSWVDREINLFVCFQVFPSFFPASRIRKHCKLDSRRRLNLITGSTLWPRCSPFFDLTHKYQNRNFIQFHFVNSKLFCSFQQLFNKRSYDWKHTRIQSYVEKSRRISDNKQILIQRLKALAKNRWEFCQ